MKTKTNNQSGFTLLEILIAMVILAIGSLGMTSFIGSVIQKNGISEKRTMAAVIAESKVEELRNKMLVAGLAAADTDTDLADINAATENYITSDNGNFSQIWVVDDTLNPHTVTVTVAWDGPTASTSQFVLTSLINDINDY